MKATKRNSVLENYKQKANKQVHKRREAKNEAILET